MEKVAAIRTLLFILWNISPVQSLNPKKQTADSNVSNFRLQQVQ